MDNHEYALCTKCDHFVEENEEHLYNPEYATHLHLEDGEQEFDHDATPGMILTGDQWDKERPDLFTEYADGKIGPNSIFHSRRGKV